MKPARRPHWPLLSAGLFLLAYAATSHRGIFDALVMSWGTIAIGVYVDQLLRWLKGRP